MSAEISDGFLTFFDSSNKVPKIFFALKNRIDFKGRDVYYWNIHCCGLRGTILSRVTRGLNWSAKLFMSSATASFTAGQMRLSSTLKKQT